MAKSVDAISASGIFDDDKSSARKGTADDGSGQDGGTSAVDGQKEYGAEHEFTPGNEWLETFSGCRCNPLADDPQFELEDLIWGNARECRYSGQLKPGIELYSVAEHEVLLTRWLSEEANARELIGRAATEKELRTVAMHDSTEGVMKDMIRPLKHLFPDFSKAEAIFYSKIAKRFDLIDPLPAWLKAIDSRIIRDERAQAMNPSSNVWATDSLQPLGVQLRFWLPRQAAVIYADTLRGVGVG